MPFLLAVPAQFTICVTLSQTVKHTLIYQIIGDGVDGEAGQGVNLKFSSYVGAMGDDGVVRGYKNQIVIYTRFCTVPNLLKTTLKIPV
jgi:hypothetical protein